MSVAIKVNHLTKKYLLGQTHNDLLSEKFTNRLRSLYDYFTSKNATPEKNTNRLTEREIYALKDVTFEVQQGDVLGIIGRNGAGKSTLLKILSRVTTPTSGEVEICGRIASLLEVGTGFHPELTGKENIYLNGAILGMNRNEIRHKFDEIVDFAGIAKFLDTPVKRYSSGMYVRLAFSVAAHLDPEILVVDEVLSVGDAEFQRKCLGKMGEVSQAGRTVLLVSHNMLAIQSLCHTGLLLSEGSIIATGDIESCISQYKKGGETERLKSLHEREDRTGNRKLLVEDFWLENNRGVRVDTVSTGDKINIVIKYRANEALSGVDVGINFYDVDGYILTNLNNRDIGFEIKTAPSKGHFVCVIPSFPLRKGLYRGNLWVEVEGQIADCIRPAFEIKVEDGDFFGTGRLLGQGKFVTNYGWFLRE